MTQPDPTRPDVTAAAPIETQHITTECRANKGQYVAWEHAVHLLRHVYEAQVSHDPDATISIAIYRTPREAQP